MPVGPIKQHLLAAIDAACRAAYDHAPEGLAIDFPPDLQLGHFAAGCFPLSKTLRRSPADIARTLAAAIGPDDLIAGAAAAGPYINFTLRPGRLFGEAIAAILSAGGSYGDSAAGAERRVMVEYLSPNTNKPLHLGHLRNAALGIAVSRMLAAAGHPVVKSILINDRGVHICKSMLAWERFAGGATPHSEGLKGDHFVGRWYVRYAIESEKDPSLEQGTQAMLRRWEEGDPATIDLWKRMNRWVYDGFAETYRRFGMDFDVFYYESDTYRLGKDVIAGGLAQGVFGTDERGNTVFHLPEKPFGREKDGALKKVTVLRPDGTSLYITQDIGTAILKVTEHDLHSSVYVVGSEQEHHFKCLFAILAALGYAWAPNCHHLSYGMVYLPEGKMKSREGKVVDADDLIAGMQELAEEEIRRRDPEKRLSAEEIRHRAEVIGVGAIKYYLLRVRPTQSINFDPAESISFDGFTGPYCQYAYARIFGILEKAGGRGLSAGGADFGLLGNPEELLLLKMLIQFPAEVASGVAEYNPSRVAVHVFNTAKAFNQFYNKHAVIQAESPALAAARLALIRATAAVLKRGLELLGIGVLENM
ncbi:MAG: arginine--tRNA ligase [Desulfobacterales bacterium]|jgi:arginyl-tRNA synthetase|nr:arginine--tRNA ligase [Desulfobacterales bacterium]